MPLTIYNDYKSDSESFRYLRPMNHFRQNPFGMLVQERVYTAKEYRFGYNGQEKDDEISGNGNSNTAEYWQYDTRLGRRWNVDPLMGKYPSSSPFACFNNNPMLFSDPLGLEGEPTGGSGTRRALNQANSIVRELENDPDAGKDWNYSITWDNKRSGYTIQGENGGGGTMNQSGEADKFFVKYTFKDRVSDFFSSSDAQVHSSEFESNAILVGQTITELHPGVGLYNFTKGMGQKAGLWEDGSNIWGEDQSNASLALETVGVAGDFVKSGIKVLKIAEGKFKKPKKNLSGKEGAKDVPHWAKGNKPKVGENGDQFARRILDEKYGKGNYDTNSQSEFSKIKKWGDRAFEL